MTLKRMLHLPYLTTQTTPTEVHSLTMEHMKQTQVSIPVADKKVFKIVGGGGVQILVC